MKRKFNRSSSWRCVEYWTSRGYSEQDALINISQKQKEISSKQPKGITRSDHSRQLMRDSAIARNSVDYWIEKYGEVDGPTQFNNYKHQLSLNGKKSIDSRKKSGHDFRTSTPRCVEFWMKRGYSVTDAAVKVSEIQSTFSLSKCISMCGEQEGILRWQRRQVKWRDSYLKNNMDTIRLKQKQNASDGVYTRNNIPDIDSLLFYLIKITKESQTCLKYGLTKHADVSKRWGINTNKFHYDVICQFRLPPHTAISLESALRDRFKNTSTTTVFNLTEIVDVENTAEVMEIVDNFKQE